MHELTNFRGIRFLMGNRQGCTFVKIILSNLILPFFRNNRAEKEKCQYLCEVNDLRASLDHITNEKVYN